MGLFVLSLLFISLEANVVSLPSNIPLKPIRSSGFQLGVPTLSSTATVISGHSLDLKETEIAFISCDKDDYDGGYLGVGQTIEYVTFAHPAAQTATHCNFTSDAQTAVRFSDIFTFKRRDGYSALRRAVNQSSPVIEIVSMSLVNTGTDTGDTGASGDNPNTAMIILYSITGVITALFLGIIITGAVRAHRHPERYGPRRIAGRVRQSRARGIARAMLDTIPIVKFDDPHDDVEAAKRDVEMSMSSEDPNREHPATQGEGTTAVSTAPESGLHTTEEDERPTCTAPTLEARTETVSDVHPSCPICTDDFIKGQDLRVLPCNHQFHVECIDPWLMNVSGTCPLCRIDLNPPQETTEGADDNADQTQQATEGAEPETTEEARQQARQQARHTHRRLTNYLHGPLNARRMRDATVEERLAALRRVREENQGESAVAEESARRSLAARLRARFRIRTRAHGTNEAESSVDAEAAAPPPVAPAPAHLTQSSNA
ncbi:Zinc finger RING-type [Penicillium sp. DV-2018c]|nr:Zinc finger RING-type [Penicillium sp. DV-2018c]KAJ5571214.1 Zinc finger RING-type [Penicillium sp. DV-2018c]